MLLRKLQSVCRLSILTTSFQQELTKKVIYLFNSSGFSPAQETSFNSYAKQADAVSNLAMQTCGKTAEN